MDDIDLITARRRLRTELKQRRIAAELTQRDVANQLYISPSKVIRIESGQVSVSVNDLRALLALYEVRDKRLIDELMGIAQSIRGRRPPYQEFKDILSPEAFNYVSYELSCDYLHNYEVLLVSGLLQTEDYTREILTRVLSLDDDTVQTQMQLRQQRQRQLEESSGRHFQFIHDEAVIRRVIGGTQVMREQLEHLRLMNLRDNIDVAVIPFGEGAYPGMRGPVVLMEFGSDSDVVYLENSRGDAVFRDDPDVTLEYQNLFLDLEDRVAEAEPLDSYLDRAIERLPAEQEPSRTANEVGGADQPE